MSPQAVFLGGPYPARMTLRTDDQTAAWIALAVFLRHTVDREFAACLLTRRGVSVATIARVMETLRRREF